jgi:predicted HD phosphohydrolase
MEALRLRIWDDLAKDPDMETRPVAHFMGYVEQSLDVQRGNRN